MHMRAHKQQVRVISPASHQVESPHTAPAIAISKPDTIPEMAQAEINVIGSTAEEAMARVDKFLDQAFLDGRFRLRVIHGHGKGILRKALQEMFATHPQVEKHYPAPPQEGGTGATIVELKL